MSNSEFLLRNWDLVRTDPTLDNMLAQDDLYETPVAKTPVHKKKVSITIDAHLYDEIKLLANKEGRTVSGIINNFIDKGINSQVDFFN